MIRPVPSWARLIRLCQRRGRSREDAEDLIQTALLRLEEYCRTAENKIRDPERFLTTTVRNLVANQVRRERIITYAPDPVEELVETLGLTDPGPTPDRVLDAEERLNEIRMVLEAVSQRARDVYFLHMAGYEYREIGKKLGITVKTVEAHMARAILAMAKWGVPR